MRVNFYSSNENFDCSIACIKSLDSIYSIGSREPFLTWKCFISEYRVDNFNYFSFLFENKLKVFLKLNEYCLGSNVLQLQLAQT